MKLLITYEGYDADGSYRKPLLPVEAESMEAAMREFRDAAVKSLTRNKSQFSVFGWKFHHRNFFDIAPQAFLQKQNRELAARGEASVPVYQGPRGDLFILTMPDFFTLEGWFDAEHAKRADEEEALTA